MPFLSAVARVFLHSREHLGSGKILHAVALTIPTANALETTVTYEAVIVRNAAGYGQFSLKHNADRAPILGGITGSTFITVDGCRIAPEKRLYYSCQQGRDNPEQRNPVQIECPASVLQVGEELVPVNPGKHHRLVEILPFMFDFGRFFF